MLGFFERLYHAALGTPCGHAVEPINVFKEGAVLMVAGNRCGYQGSENDQSGVNEGQSRPRSCDDIFNSFCPDFKPDNQLRQRLMDRIRMLKSYRS